MYTTQHTMKRIALLLFSILFGLGVQAQQNMLRLVPNSFLVRNLNTGMSASDTVYTSFGDSLEYEAQVIYTGAPSLVDEIGLGISPDSLMGFNNDSIYASISFQDTLFSNDTITIKITDQVDSSLARYSGGTGGGAIVVVVWPVLRIGVSTKENNAHIILNFTERTAIEDPRFTQGDRIQCFPNPVQNRLYFREKERISKFESVRIQDMLGKPIFEAKEMPFSIHTDHWPQGMYLIEIRYRDGLKEVFKVEKQ